MSEVKKKFEMLSLMNTDWKFEVLGLRDLERKREFTTELVEPINENGCYFVGALLLLLMALVLGVLLLTTAVKAVTMGVRMEVICG